MSNTFIQLHKLSQGSIKKILLCLLKKNNNNFERNIKGGYSYYM